MAGRACGPGWTDRISRTGYQSHVPTPVWLPVLCSHPHLVTSPVFSPLPSYQSCVLIHAQLPVPCSHPHLVTRPVFTPSPGYLSCIPTLPVMAAQSELHLWCNDSKRAAVLCASRWDPPSLLGGPLQLCRHSVTLLAGCATQAWPVIYFLAEIII